MRENTTRALIAALVLLVSSTATSTEAAGKAVKRPPRCGNTHVCRHRPKSHPAPLPPDYAQWSRVAQCEESGWYAAISWIPREPGDSGGYTILGINGANWIAYSRRLRLSPTLPSRGSTTLQERLQAIEIGDAIEHGIDEHGRAIVGGYIPDQNGCGNGW